VSHELLVSRSRVCEKRIGQELERGDGGEGVYEIFVVTNYRVVFDVVENVTRAICGDLFLLYAPDGNVGLILRALFVLLSSALVCRFRD